MTASRVLLLYVLTTPVFFLIDMAWLGVVARGFYRSRLGSLLAPQFNWTAAILFYLLYIGGILFFAVLPALERQSLPRAIGLGAALGLVAYATYDLTNLATLRDWSLPLTIVDILWGIVLTGSVSAAAYGIGRWLGAG